MKTSEETKRSADEMIDKLNQIKEAKLAKKEAERKRREVELNDLINRVKNLIPSITELKKVVDKMYDIKIPNAMFITINGQNNIGFYSSYHERDLHKTNNLFGIAGDGHESSFVINLKTKDMYYGKYPLHNEICMKKMKKIINEFDEFEESIINYVNNLSSNDN